MANFTIEKTAADNIRHSGIVDGDRAVVNMAIATLYASIYCVFSEEAVKLNIKVPSYSWFLLQFWPCSSATLNMMQYTGKFTVRQMVPTR